MKKQRKKTLSKSQKIVVAAMRAGFLLYEEFEEGESVYHIPSIGKLDPRTVKSLEARGFIKGASDAMFGVSQTFNLCEATCQ